MLTRSRGVQYARIKAAGELYIEVFTTMKTIRTECSMVH